MSDRGRARLPIAALAIAILLACGPDGPTDPIVDIIDPRDLCGGICYPRESWMHAPSPGALAWSPTRLDQARVYSGQIGSNTVMVIDRGLVVTQWGATAREHIVQSVRKSFLSAVYGIYHDEGMIDLSLDMAQLGIDDIPPSLTDIEKQATLELLLQARSGVYHEAAAESQSMKDARPPRGSHMPGTFWYYNNWDFNVLGVAFTQLTGLGVFEALHERLAEPLDMQDFEPSDGFYHYEPISEHPAYPFAMSARDMARFGLLLAREGRWGDRQIVPEVWVEQSTEAYSDAGSTWDYGYMWWIARPAMFGGLRMFSARGGSGHAIFVFPDLDVVVVHRVDAPTYRYGWSEVMVLLDLILDARVG